MKKIFLIYMLFFIAAFVWCMPPKPGANFTHDGSLYCNVIENTVYSADDGVLRVLPRTNNDVVLTPTPVSKTILVLLVEFSDYGFNSDLHGCISSTVHRKEYYEKLLGGDSSFSMRKYYEVMSNGKFLLDFKVLGPYTANTYASYGKDDAAGDDINVSGLVSEILFKAKNDIIAAGSSIDPCTVIFIHAGPGQEEYGNSEEVPEEYRNLIWSCSSALSKAVEINGKAYKKYTIQPEYIIGNGCDASIGVFCHEFGHVLGLPDLYDTSYATAGVGNWSLMGAGSWGSDKSGNDPAPLMNWEKATLGWIPETVIDVSSTPYQVNFKNADDAAELLRINLDADKNQYLVFEGKKKASVTDKFVPEDGLLITQIHEGVYKGKLPNNVNSGSSRVHAVSIVEAKSDNYAKTGLGFLWQGSGNEYRTTRTACFRSDTATSVGPMVNGRPVAASHPLIIILFKTMLTSAAIVGVISAVWRGRKKLCLALAGAVTMIFICLACDAGGGGGFGPSSLDSGPNTNYYENKSDVHSKTGLSGIRIYDIRCNADGSGSFWVRKE